MASLDALDRLHCLNEYYATYGFEGGDLFPGGVGCVPSKAGT